MDRNKKIWYLERLNLFKMLPKSELDFIEKMTLMHKFKKGDSIYFADEYATRIFILKEGKIKLTILSESGKEMIIGIIGSGGIFGYSPLLGDSYRNENARSIEDSIVCSIVHQHFIDYVRQNPDLNLEITKLIGFRMKKIQSQLESLVFASAENRIRNLLKELANEFGKKLALTNEILIKMNLTHEDYAKLTATSRQMVTTVLSNLEKEGIISYSRRKIFIHDLNKL